MKSRICIRFERLVKTEKTSTISFNCNNRVYRFEFSFLLISGCFEYLESGKTFKASKCGHSNLLIAHSRPNVSRSDPNFKFYIVVNHRQLLPAAIKYLEQLRTYFVSFSFVPTSRNIEIFCLRKCTLVRHRYSFRVCCTQKNQRKLFV